MFMNRKGQALVEFIMILPVFLLILLAIVDFGNLLYSKNELQNQSTDIIRMIQSGTEISEISKIYSKVDVKVEAYEDDYEKVVLTEKIDIITPFLDRILGDPCSVEVERIIPNVK